MTDPMVASKDLKWTREGFHRRALQDPATPPPKLSLADYRSLPAADRRDYNQRRFLWHEGLEFMLLRPESSRLKEHVLATVRSQPGPLVAPKRGLWVDGESNTGKSTAVMEASFELVRDALAHGEVNAAGNLITAVVWIDLSERPTFRAINRDGCAFLNTIDLAPDNPIPASRRDATSHQLAKKFASWAIACGVQLIVLDDTHNLKNRFAEADMTGNYLKHLMTLVPAVFVLIGTDIRKNTELLNEGSPLTRIRTQTPHRYKTHSVRPFYNRTDAQRREWVDALKSVEKRLVLCSPTRGVLTGRPDYIYERTGGFVGSLVAFARDMTYAAITSTSDEVVHQELLDGITVDYAAESGPW
ncbi:MULTISPECIES: hypothetical protein [unclassified Frigoribacterium]|uniref:hypothetical protein n=1 Tax=unclassified Frigoribacterium TaxID=2627005 RepID=UPI001565C6CC|nr:MULTISPECIES: hypothetical protein [unclassified Frigoribacterium]NQW87516.1 hypothetical protein [Frigoribacterium sp. VKM Ac-2860]NQX09675.1 hypothetical protein [Frigoribacterium sp. VKM Ac-2859]